MGIMEDQALHQHVERNWMKRRGFLKAAAAVLGGLVALVLGAPMVVTLVAPIYRKQKGHFAKVGRIESLPQGEPANLSFQSESEDAYLRHTLLHDVWVIKHSSTEFTVFSPICTHLGCRYNWDAGAREFHCPCHGSVFSIEGKVLGGPAPRPLDTLPHRIESGELFVEWERFQPGVTQKLRI